MRTVAFGKTGMNITPIGFGAWAIGGGGWRYAWGPQDDADSIATIHAALDAGLNWIDTAAIYGLGHSETVVARALKGMSERPYVFTKCNMVWDAEGNISHSMKADSIRHEVEQSLRRLEIEVIDLYQIHWPFPDEGIEEGWQTLVELQQAGKVRHIGVSNFNVAQMERCRSLTPVETLQPPYSLVKPQVEDEILPYCHEHNIGVIVYSPMYAGLLTGAMTKERIATLPDDDWRKRDEHFQEPKVSRHLALAALLGEIAHKHNVPQPAVSVAWTLLNAGVTAAIVGARRPDQIQGFLAAADLQLDTEDVARIEAFRRDNP